MSDIPIVQLNEFPNAMAFMNSIHIALSQKEKGNLSAEVLPVHVQIGKSRFTVTKENFELLSLGVLMAVLWEEGE
jgi:hypothetical protein